MVQAPRLDGWGRQAPGYPCELARLPPEPHPPLTVLQSQPVGIRVPGGRRGHPARAGPERDQRVDGAERGQPVKRRIEPAHPLTPRQPNRGGKPRIAWAGGDGQSIIPPSHQVDGRPLTSTLRKAGQTVIVNPNLIGSRRHVRTAGADGQHGDALLGEVMITTVVIVGAHACRPSRSLPHFVPLSDGLSFGILYRSSSQADTTITLPIGVEAYALRAWLAREDWISDRTRRFAKWSAICSFALGMAGQVAYHLLAQAGAMRAPWPITTLVSCLPAGPGPGHADRAGTYAARRRRRAQAGHRDRRTGRPPVLYLVPGPARRGPARTGPGPRDG
jgi:hypothetical protein